MSFSTGNNYWFIQEKPFSSLFNDRDKKTFDKNLIKLSASSLNKAYNS